MAETVLQKIVSRKHYKFLEEQVTWQEAVKLSTDSLVADGTVEPDYYKQIVDCIEKYGPYMVFDLCGDAPLHGERGGRQPDRDRLHGLQERHRLRHGRGR